MNTLYIISVAFFSLFLMAILLLRKTHQAKKNIKKLASALSKKDIKHATAIYENINEQKAISIFNKYAYKLHSHSLEKQIETLEKITNNVKTNLNRLENSLQSALNNNRLDDAETIVINLRQDFLQLHSIPKLYDWKRCLTLFSDYNTKRQSEMAERIKRIITQEKKLLHITEDDDIENALQEISKSEKYIEQHKHLITEDIQNKLNRLSDLKTALIDYRFRLYIQEYQKTIEAKKIDDALSLEKTIDGTIRTIDNKELLCEYNVIKDKFRTDQKKGILIDDVELRVGYDSPSDTPSATYAYAKYPKTDSIVWPYRRKIIGRRGFTELDFENKLKSTFSPGFLIVGDANLLPQDGCRPYEPDIAIIDNNSGLNIRIDIEIDEPYEGLSRRPIHCIGDDEFRDSTITRLGWIVIRFSEKQIKCETINCIAYIARIIKSLNPDYNISDLLSSVPDPSKENKWTKIEAQNKATSKERENYLGKTGFGVVPQNTTNSADLTLTDFERSLLSKVKPLDTKTLGSQEDFDGYNKNNKHTLDSFIRFNEQLHLYSYKGLELISVSSIVSSFFPEFDAIYWAKKNAQTQGISPDQLREEWTIKGTRSRELGTFLHKQIENHFLGNTILENYSFSYNGNYFQLNEDLNITRELTFFKNFIHENKITPYRTEWRIFDLQLRIAGTIDCLCKNVDDTYDMYDWKRTERIEKTNPFATGLGELATMEDTPRNHYFLQQNLYKHILEKSYKLKIRNMKLVVLHPIYEQYIIIDVPSLAKETKYILEHL